MDKYAELRAALDAGPVGGEWGIGDSDLPVSRLSIHAVDGQKHSTIARMVKTDHRVWCAGEFVATWKYIAAAHPEVIRALLAERDALLDQHHRDSKELRRLCAQRDAARKVSKEAGAVIADLKAERDALQSVLEAIVSHHDDYFKDSATESNMPWIGQARAALAQGQEEP